jgi:glycosyltransferase involved in cell wall biosynthesis
MIRILVVSPQLKKGSVGGLLKSSNNIFNGLGRLDDFQIKTIAFNPLKKTNKIFIYFKMGNLLYIRRIIKEINRYKPHVIISQASIAIPTIISARIKKIPMINIVRDVSIICPKNIDVISYGKPCSGLKGKNPCYNCINNWRSLRVIIGDKPHGWQYSLNAVFSTIFFKLKFFVSRLNLKMMNRATMNVVASELMKSLISTYVNPKKIRILNITPIKKIILPKSIEKKNQFLYILPTYEESYKGLHFILSIAKSIPDNYKILIVGRKLPPNKLKGLNSKIINYGPINTDILNSFYQNSKITLVPSFCNEGFGRVIIESVINKTPVISSPSCGANYYFKDKKFLKVISVKLPLWMNAIKEMIENPYKITNDDIDYVYKQFSIDKSVRDFLNLIKNLV